MSSKKLLLFCISIILLLFGCRENVVEVETASEPLVKIVSPLASSNYLKHDNVYFEAYLLSGNDTLIFDSLKWLISGYNYELSGQRFNIRLSAGNHNITCTIFRENKIYSNQVEITIQNNVFVDMFYHDDKFTFYEIADDHIYYLAVDHDDNIIVGTESTGLYILKNNSWINYDKNDGLIHNSIFPISLDKDNNIYLGYFPAEGISKITANGITNMNVDVPNAGSVNYIMFDESNILWAATLYGVICKYENGGWITFPEQENVDFHHPRKIQFDSKKNLWGASDYASLKYDGQNWDSVFVNGNVVRALSMVIDKNDVVWYGCHNGLYKLSETDTVIYNYSNSNLPANTVWSLALDSQNNLLVGTDNGLVKFDGKSWEAINLPVGGNRIFRLAVDSNDKIWFSCSSYESGSAVFGSYKN